ncbi:MAG: pilus assembly protein CpaE [Chloroflexota bacterium]|nr:pilus assembly protein CpaE [Chloroflexota bacterium]
MVSTTSQIRLLLVEDVAQVAQYIRNLLNAQDQVKLLDVISDGRRVIEQIREVRPDILMVDALLQGKVNGLEVAERVRQAGLDIPIITLTVPQKPIKIGQGMGVVKVLAMPFSGFDFMNAIQAAMAEYKALSPESISRTYCIYAPKGGVGKTTLAFNLAVAIGQLGGFKVALIDGNLQFGDLRALLRVPESAPSVLQLPTDRISETDLQDVLWRDPSGIDILLAPPRVEMAEMITTRDLDKTISLLKRIYNVIVIDTPTTLNDAVLEFFDASDVILNVVTFDSTTIANSRAMARTYQEIGYPTSKIRYVLNRADSAGGMSPKELAEQIGRQPEFQVVSDGRLVVEANNQGIPFVLSDPAARISHDLVKMAQALTAPSAVPLAAAGRR